MKHIELTEQQCKERKQVWDKLRADHHANKPKGDADRIAHRAEYKIARNNLYREYFKKDYPDVEVLIDKDEALKKMAETEMRRIVFRFYRGNGKGMVIQNVLAGANVPARIAIHQEALPSGRPRAHEQPYQDGQEEHVGKGWD